MSESAIVTTKHLLETMAEANGKPIGLGKAAELAGKSSDFEFTFEYLSFMFAVKAASESQRTHMSFRANLGRVPFTSENARNRSRVLAIVDVAGQMLGSKVHIDSGQRIMLAEEFYFDEPLTPNLLLSKLAQMLIRSKPYLEILAESVNTPVRRNRFALAATNS